MLGYLKSYHSQGISTKNATINQVLFRQGERLRTHPASQLHEGNNRSGERYST